MWANPAHFFSDECAGPALMRRVKLDELGTDWRLLGLTARGVSFLSFDVE